MAEGEVTVRLTRAAALALYAMTHPDVLARVNADGHPEAKGYLAAAADAHAKLRTGLQEAGRDG